MPDDPSDNIGRLLLHSEPELARREGHHAEIGADYGQRLDDARAEFRMAWQAKLDRVHQIRERVGKAQQVGTWTTKIGALAILWSGSVLVLCLIAGTDLDAIIRMVAFRVGAHGLLICGLVRLWAQGISALYSRSADRLEAKEIRLP